MEKTTYIVEPKDREEFYNYLRDNQYIRKHFTKEDIINSKFPFYIDVKKKTFTIIASITCCACAASNKQIIYLD